MPRSLLSLFVSLGFMPTARSNDARSPRKQPAAKCGLSLSMTCDAYCRSAALNQLPLKAQDSALGDLVVNVNQSDNRCFFNSAIVIFSS